MEEKDLAATRGRKMKFKRGDIVDRLSWYDAAPSNGKITRLGHDHHSYLVEWPGGGGTWEDEADLTPRGAS